MDRISSRADLERFIEADRRNLHISSWRLHHRLTRPEAEFQRQLRIAEYWTNTASSPGRVLLAYLARWRARRTGQRLGFTIPPNVFGPGLSIAHIGTIVVNPRASVGANCRIAHLVTLGEANGRPPIIGDDVHISPHVAVIGAQVGDGCGLLTGAVVTKDIPAFSDAGGVPARVLRTEPGRDPWWKGWTV